MITFKNDLEFVLKYAIKNDDSAKDKFSKLNAQTYLLDKTCKRLVRAAKENRENQLVKTIIEAQRNMAARDLYKRFADIW